MTQKELRRALGEGLAEYGHVRCQSCNSKVNLEGADDVSEAGEIWNQHLVECPETDTTEADIPA